MGYDHDHGRGGRGGTRNLEHIWVFPKIGVPQNGWFIMENPIKMDDLGVPLFSETAILYSLKLTAKRTCPRKVSIPKRKRSSSNHPFSGPNIRFREGVYVCTQLYIYRERERERLGPAQTFPFGMISPQDATKIPSNAGSPKATRGNMPICDWDHDI